MKANHHAHPYGVGLAYRYSVHHEAMRHRDEIDLFEISTEDYIVRERRTYADPDESLLREALAEVPSVAHGLTLSIGSVAPLNPHYLAATTRFLKEHGLSVFSEHLAFHAIDGKDLSVFLAMPFEEVSIEWLKTNYELASQALGRDFALENVTYHFPVPHGTLSEADYLRRLTEETNCSLLLDVTNVFNNSRNHGYDAIEFFNRLPMDRVTQMHLAGGHQHPDGRWEDSHSTSVMPEVWPLYEEALKRAHQLQVVILERDSQLHPFGAVMDDLRRARELFYQHRPSQPVLTSRATLAPADSLSAMSSGRQDDHEHFAQLRAYQRGLMARLTDPHYEKSFQTDPRGAAARFGLTEENWIRKLQESSPSSVANLARAWGYFQQEDKAIAEEYRRREWAAWAEQMRANF